MFKKIALAAALTCTATIAQADAFKFIALGDMPYGQPAKVFPLYEKLIETINARRPDFVVHVGDTKSGGTPCSNEMLDAQLAYMNSFEAGVLYTPGDNEWTDCYRKKAGKFDPLERLTYIRQTYFSEPAKSFGKSPLDIESQAVLHADTYATYPENVRYQRDGVHFILAHVVGSNNNLEARDPKAAMEFFDRNAANVAWLNESFDKAAAEQAKAVALVIHADMFEFGFNEFGKETFLRHSGFKQFGEALVKKATDFAKPVLLIYGDSHVHRVIRPFPQSAPNITALEVYGSKDMHAVEVTVEPDDPAVFGFRSVLNPAL